VLTVPATLQRRPAYERPAAVVWVAVPVETAGKGPTGSGTSSAFEPLLFTNDLHGVLGSGLFDLVRVQHGIAGGLDNALNFL